MSLEPVPKPYMMPIAEIVELLRIVSDGGARSPRSEPGPAAEGSVYVPPSPGASNPGAARRRRRPGR